MKPSAVESAALHILVILAAGVALIRGWRKGLARQTGDVLALAFGTVSAYIASPLLAADVSQLVPAAEAWSRDYIVSALPSCLVFMGVAVLVRLCASPVGRLLHHLWKSILDRLFGAAFSLLWWMMWLSVGFNLFLCWQPDSRLASLGGRDDGNAVEEVMLLAPALLGCSDVEDLWHLRRLEEAKYISLNHRGENIVVNEAGHLCPVYIYILTDNA